MKRKLLLTLVASALLALVRPADARAVVARASYSPGMTVSVSMFYSELAPWGTWVNVAPYGWCWEPDAVYADWRPYSDGSWIYTDLGWTWVSDEPWAWAAYHYGRWFYDPIHGWVWLPDTEWGPAWVVWRTDLDWVGWAPLPPASGWGAWFQVTSSDYVRLEPRAWCFTRVQDMSARNLRDRIVPVGRNAGLIGRTHDATRYGRHDGRPFNRGVDVALVERRMGGKLPRMAIRDAERPGGGWHGDRNGGVGFFRPRVERARPGEAPGVAAREHRRDHEVAYERRAPGSSGRPEWRRRGDPPADVRQRQGKGDNRKPVKPERKRGPDGQDQKDGPRDRH